jgi:hypothetical protein
MSDLTDLQQSIVDEHRRDDSQTDAEIAAKLGCSASYVNQTRNEHGDTGGSNGLGWIVLAAVLGLLFLAQTGAI